MTPFPQEPAFGSPEAVEQASETIRRCPMCRQDIPLKLRLEHADECLGFNVGDETDERPPFQQIVLLEAEVERLRAEVADRIAIADEMGAAYGSMAAAAGRLTQRRDALADAAIALMEEVPYACPARDRMREALRKAGRL